jgi:hypothetical protein
LQDVPQGVTLRQDDALRDNAGDRTFSVADAQPDGMGCMRLMLNETTLMRFRCPGPHHGSAAADRGRHSRVAQATSSKDTPVPDGKTPAIIVYTDDHKLGLGGTPPQFRTTVLTHH